MTKSTKNQDSIDHVPPVEAPQIIALVGSHAPEEVRAAAADALVDTHVRLDYRIIFPTTALTLTYMAQAMISITYGTISSYINQDVGPTATYTWMSSAWTMACAIVLPISGPLGDNLGRRYFFIAGNLIAVVAAIVASTAQSVEVVIVGTTLSGVAAAFQQLAIAAVSEIYPNKYRGLMQAVLENVPMAFAIAGPYATRAGYDVIGAAEGGLLHITGEADGPPTKPGVGLVDMCTGLYLHGAIVSALLARQRTGAGQKLGTSLFEATVSILANVDMSWVNLEKEARRWGTAHPAIVPYEAFRTKDGSLVIGAMNDRQFWNLCKLLGDRDLAADPRYIDNSARVLNRKELKQRLDTLFMEKTTEEWEAVLEGSGMPYGPINTLEKVFSHPQALARRMVETVGQDEAVTGTIKVLGIPVKFSETKPSIRGGPPSLGQHTHQILRELGYSSSAISDLRKYGAI